MIPVLSNTVKLYIIGVIVVAFMGTLGYAGYQYQRAEAAENEVVAVLAEMSKNTIKYEADVAAATGRVVVEYKEKIRTIREEVPVEVLREVEVIRQSDCVFPPPVRWLHDYATGSQAPEAGGIIDASETIDCITLYETVVENYRLSRENSAQLKALQDWVETISSKETK